MSSPEPDRLTADVFSAELGRALSMERDIFSLLAALEAHTAGDEAKELLREHARQAQHHITSIENAFQLLGRDIDDGAPVTVTVMGTAGRIETPDGGITDALILAEAAGAEHQQIAVYETLITDADGDVAAVLRNNLEQDRTALAAICGAARRLAA